MVCYIYKCFMRREILRKKWSCDLWMLVAHNYGAGRCHKILEYIKWTWRHASWFVYALYYICSWTSRTVLGQGSAGCLLWWPYMGQPSRQHAEHQESSTSDRNHTWCALTGNFSGMHAKNHAVRSICIYSLLFLNCPGPLLFQLHTHAC